MVFKHCIYTSLYINRIQNIAFIEKVPLLHSYNNYKNIQKKSVVKKIDHRKKRKRKCLKMFFHTDRKVDT